MITGFAVPILSVVIIFLARILELGTKRNTDSGVIRERLTLTLFILAGVVMLACGIAELTICKRQVTAGLFVAGWVCGLLSFYVRRQAIGALGRFWSLHVEIRNHHQLIKTGPFRWMRHPTYFSMILELLSGCLILNARYALVATAVFFLPTLWWRLRLEETALIEKFGDDYRAYQQSTPAIIPYRWPTN